MKLFNPHNEKGNSNKKELIRKLSSMVEVEVDPKGWFSKKFRVRIWFTPKKF